ncbi:MAG: cell division ATP-binding protein FtsE [Oscillospiraceae bacterium]|nr:cell division ATP-binding protein FtsE [Oscillospiraceae bacterium]
MIEFKNVDFAYESDSLVLENINLKINDGEFVFIVGSSGAGKSSIFKLLRREEVATKGEVIVGGYNLSRLSNKDIPTYRRTLGVVFQDFRLIKSMTVYENVAFALRVTNVSSRDIRRRVPYILGLVGLGPKAKKYPDQISGGEQQRVSLARALVNNPALIIADEPTGNIDPALAFDIMHLLFEINRAGTTVLVVTHDMKLVDKFGGRVITIENGKVESDVVKESKL